MESTYSIGWKEEGLEESRDFEVIASAFSNDSEPLGTQLVMAEIATHIQESSLRAQQSVALHRLVASFGDVYFFHDQTGALCLLTDIL